MAQHIKKNKSIVGAKQIKGLVKRYILGLKQTAQSSCDEKNVEKVHNYTAGPVSYSENFSEII